MLKDGCFIRILKTENRNDIEDILDREYMEQKNHNSMEQSQNHEKSCLVKEELREDVSEWAVGGSDNFQMR